MDEALKSLIRIEENSRNRVPTLAAIQKTAATYTRFVTLAKLHDEFNTASVQRAVKLLDEDAFTVPPLRAQRRNLMDFANWASSAAVTELSTTLVADKYGAFLERLLANPFVQDQMLLNPTRWQSVVTLGLTAVGPSPVAIEHAHTKETRTFLRNFEVESRKCSRDFNKAVHDGGVLHAKKVMGAVAPSTSGPGCEQQLIYCDYTKRRLSNRV